MMTDKQPMQAAGDGDSAAMPDGVNSAHGDGDTGQPYPNGVKRDPGKGGFLGHGGQTEQPDSGPDDAAANAATE